MYTAMMTPLRPAHIAFPAVRRRVGFPRPHRGDLGQSVPEGRVREICPLLRQPPRIGEPGAEVGGEAEEEEEREDDLGGEGHGGQLGDEDDEDDELVDEDGRDEDDWDGGEDPGLLGGGLHPCFSPFFN